jgi:ferredoxin-NADP reductase
MTSMYAVQLQGREAVAADTMAFHFRKPADFQFKAGQTIDLVLNSSPPADAASARRTFSLVSPPFENVLTVATRLRASGFKKALRKLAVGSTAGMEGPFGSLTLHSSRARPAVFITGGIGITPFMSILRQAAYDRLRQHFILVYSNSRPEDAAFLPELQELERRMENFRLITTVTRMDGSGRPWTGRVGRIDRDLIQVVTKGAATAVYYVTGSSSMVAHLKQLLAEVGIDDDDVRSEEFHGY